MGEKWEVWDAELGERCHAVRIEAPGKMLAVQIWANDLGPSRTNEAVDGITVCVAQIGSDTITRICLEGEMSIDWYTEEESDD